VGTQYATPSDLVTTGAINATALVNVSTADQNAACVAASEKADSYLRTRYPLPLASFGTDVVMHVAWMAVYLLMTGRGYNPMAGADDQLRMRYDDAVAWFEGVAKQNINPDVTANFPPGPQYQLPVVSSQPPRGW
jgi:phage gp36-like protein